MVFSRHGYGGSGPVTWPRPFDYLTQEAAIVLPAVLQDMEVDRHVLIGHSDGATIAILSAALAPQTGLTGLVAMAPHIFVEEITLQGIEVARSRYETGLRDKLRRYHGDNVDGAFHGWAETWLHPGFRDWTIEATLPRVQVPSLLIQGREDGYASLDQIERIAAGVSGTVTQLVLENCGHSPHLDQPEPVLTAISNFLLKL